jgi:hypothetical protein
MEENWRPLSVRTGQKPSTAFDELHEGVPSWMEKSLRSWIAGLVSRQTGFGDSVANNEVIHELERRLRRDLNLSGAGETRLDQFMYLVEDDAFALDVADALVCMQPKETAALEPMLSQAGSAWRATKRGLERRVSEAAQAQFEATQAGRAGEHLRQAWSSAYGRKPNASDAYREAVRGVEVYVCRALLPNDAKATLGKALGQLRADPSKLRCVLQGADATATAVAMLDLLWKSQRDRHGTADEAAPLHVSLEEAQAALHLAITIVQWFQSGALSTV